MRTQSVKDYEQSLRQLQQALTAFPRHYKRRRRGDGSNECKERLQ